MTDKDLREETRNIITKLANGERITDDEFLLKEELNGISNEAMEQNKLFWIPGGMASKLIGKLSSGIVIPYFEWDSEKPITYTPPGETSSQPFFATRLDSPEGGGKYHRPPGSTSQIYSPLNGRELLDEENHIVLVEGEKKAISLREQGIPAIAISGIWNFKIGGKDELLPDLHRLIQEKDIAKVCYLGDTDTSLNYDFSLAVVKLKALLPGEVSLTLPRIPYDQPKGVDDVIAEVGSQFRPLWASWSEDAMEIGHKMSPDEISLRLIEREISKIPDDGPEGRGAVSKLAKVASRCEPLYQDEIMELATLKLRVTKTVFREQIRASKKGREVVQDTTVDGVPVVDIKLPNKEFAEKVLEVVKSKVFFFSGQIGRLQDREFMAMSPDQLSVFMDDPSLVCFINSTDRTSARAEIRVEHARRVIAGAQLTPSNLREVKMFSNVPVFRWNEAEGECDLMEGYCEKEKVLVIPSKDYGKSFREAFEETGLDEAVERICKLLRDFRFPTEGDFLRAFACVLTPAAMQGGLLGKERAPYFHLTKEEQGTGGGTFCQMMGRLCGQRPRSISNLTQKEMDLAIGGWLMGSSDTIAYLDNITGDAIDKNANLASFVTEESYNARALYKQQFIDVTGRMLMGNSNGAALGDDMIARTVEICLHNRPDNYKYQDWNGEDGQEGLFNEISGNLPDYLGAIYRIFNEWHSDGCPKGKISGFRFKKWEKVLAGIIDYVFPEAFLMEGMDRRRQCLKSADQQMLRSLFKKVVEDEDSVGKQLAAACLARIELGRDAEDDRVGNRAKSLGRVLRKLWPDESEYQFDDLFGVKIEEDWAMSGNEKRYYRITPLERSEEVSHGAEIIDGMLERRRKSSSGGEVVPDCTGLASVEEVAVKAAVSSKVDADLSFEIAE